MNFFQRLERSLSAPRLDSYRKLGGGDCGALCRYLWNIALCEALYPSLQILEVGFRNSVHSEIATATGTPEWLKVELAFLFPPEKERITEAKNGLRKIGK